MSQVPDETSSASSSTPEGAGGAASDLESAMARAAEAVGDEGEDGEESSEGEATEEGGDAAAAGAPAKKKRRRRRKKKPGEGTASSAGAEGAPQGEGPRDGARAEGPRGEGGREGSRGDKDRPRREHTLPFNRFFGDGPPRKSLLAAGEIVGGRVIEVQHGIAVLDLFGRGIAFALDNEPREIPVLTEPAAEEPAPEASADAAATDATAPAETNEAAPAAASASTETSAGDAAPEEAPAHVDEVSHPQLTVGAVLRARIASVSESGHIAVANRIILRAESRAALAKAREEHRRVWGTVYGFNRGGFDVLVEGIRAFCPVSGMSLDVLDNPREFLGQRLEFSVQAAKSGHQGVVVSRRSLLERDMRRRARELRRNLEVGRKVKGKVTGVRDFGFFVDLGGIEGLVHMSEVSWDRHVRPADAVSVGDEVEVMILRLGGPEGRDGREGGREGRDRDRRDGRIGLSLKACLSDPWESKVSEIEEGSVRKGRITRTTEFGAFVELVPGVEGLLHISELGRDLKHANERVKEGDDLYVVIERLDVRAKRISLSKLSDADKKLVEQGGELASSGGGAGKALRVGTHIKVKIDKVEPAGLFVQVEGVIGRRGRGFIPNAEMGTERGTDHRKKFPPGMELDVKVIGNDRDGGLRLSRKGFHNDEERRAVHDYRREAASKGFGTFGDLLRTKLEK